MYVRMYEQLLNQDKSATLLKSSLCWLSPVHILQDLDQDDGICWEYHDVIYI
jgi:hypothetical protein